MLGDGKIDEAVVVVDGWMSEEDGSSRGEVSDDIELAPTMIC